MLHGDDLAHHDSSCAYTSHLGFYDDDGELHAYCDDGGVLRDGELDVSYDECCDVQARFYAFCAAAHLPNNYLPTSRKADQRVLFDVKATVVQELHPRNKSHCY